MLQVFPQLLMVLQAVLEPTAVMAAPAALVVTALTGVTAATAVMAATVGTGRLALLVFSQTFHSLSATSARLVAEPEGSPAMVVMQVLPERALQRGMADSEVLVVSGALVAMAETVETVG